MAILRRLVPSQFRSAPRIFTFSIILLLPFGYAPQEPDSALFEVGVHAGYGQIASIVRDCEGNPTSVRTNSFSDVAGSAYFRQRLEDERALVWGVRGGYWRSTANFAGYTDLTGHVDFSYVNPCVSYEGRRVGIGFGITFGTIPEAFNNFDDSENLHDHLLSTHLRIGSTDGSHFLTTFNESEPLVSGGGLWTIGVGYRAGQANSMFTGMSWLPYDPYDFGLVHQVRFRLGHSMACDLAFRGGMAANRFEGGLSAGLVWRVGR